MNKKYFIALFIIFLLFCFIFYLNKVINQKQNENKVEKIQALTRSLNASNINLEPILDETKNEQKINDVKSFALDLAKTYFDSNPNFDSEGLSVDRILQVYSGEKCGNYEIVIFQKNGIYGGSASIASTSSGSYEYLSVGPGNYSDKEYTPDKPQEIKYLTLQEATQKVLLLKSDLIFDKYVNPCILLPNGESRRFLMPDYAYFRFLDSENKAYLYIINGQYNALIDEKKAIENQIKSAFEIEDPSWLDVDYTYEEISKYFSSPIPEERIKVTRTKDGEKIFELVFDENKQVQYAALNSIMDKKILDQDLYYIEEYYDYIITNTDLSFESMELFLLEDYSKYNNLTLNDVYNKILKSSSFEKLDDKQKNHIKSFVN